MNPFDALLGRTRLKKAKVDPLFALSTAALDLPSLGLTLEPAQLGLCYRPVEEAAFDEVHQTALEMVGSFAKDHGMESRDSSDSYGFNWLVLEGAELEDRITTAHAFGQTLAEQGYSDALLAAAVPVEDRRERRALLVYNYKRGHYYPFAPRSAEQRDNAFEMHLLATLRSALPMEEDLERWYALWDAPVR